MKIESIIPPFVETNAPDEFGYWTDIKTNEKYGGQYISPLLLPNLKINEFHLPKVISR